MMPFDNRVRFSLAAIDNFGIYGSSLHYGLIIAMVGSAFLIFLWLWRCNRLDMDEEPKMQMMDDSKEANDECK